MSLINEEILNYASLHTTKPSPLLIQIERETNLYVSQPHMISGHIQGKMLALLCSLLKPTNILEIGTFTGYATVCMLETMDSGTLTTIDVNEELEERVRHYFKISGKEHLVEYLIGNALEIIPDLNKIFGLVFIDADKVNYSKYYDLVFGKVENGGLIIVDNVLWNGKVTGQSESKKDKNLIAILNFNKKVKDDDRVEKLLLPIRDGLMIMRKRSGGKKKNKKG